MKLRLTGMTAGLAVGITAAVALACAAGAYLYSVHHFETLLESARQSALAQGQLIRAALEHQMMENDRSLIAQMIRSFGTERGVDHVALLNREGLPQYSSSPLEPGNDLTIGSPTCQACHEFPAEQRMTSRVIETREGTLLRTVIPLHNRPPCHRCHDPRHRINGILIVDMNTASMRATMNRDLRWMVAGSGILMLALVTAIAFVFRLVVLRRLQRFETTARMIAAGDLARRVPAEGSDTVAWLAREFNTMADSMTGLVGEVRDQRERLEIVINSIDDGIVVLDPERKVIAANDAFLRRAGLPRGEVLGCSCRHVATGMCGPGDCPAVACLDSGERQVRICERHTADGGTAWEEVHSSPIRGPGGRVTHVVEVWRDISQRRAAEAQLAESHRLASLGLLASGFSHELNTPLATVLTCVEGILRAVPSAGGPPEEGWTRVGDHARIAREQLLRCGGITQHFLRLASGKGATIDVVALRPTFDAVARLIAPTARAHAVTIEVGPLDGDARVRANEAELQHVLLNLLLNAIEASAARGRVTLGADGTDPVVIRVRDDGCGIAAEQQQRIFEPFCSLRPGGNGLGLFLSLNFVRRWGGDIRVRSAPGRGSTFEVVLPAARDDSPGAVG